MNECTTVLPEEPALMTPSAPHRLRRPPKRLLLLVVALAGALLAVSLLPVKSWIQDAGRLREALGVLGAWKYPACILAVAVLVGCGVPRLVVCAAGGVILGFWWGLILVTAGTILGYYAVFLFVRWGGRDWVMHRWPSLIKWSDALRGQGFWAVILARQLPLHGTFVNLVLGLSHVRHRHFLIGSAIGVLPESIPTTLMGAGAGHRGYWGWGAIALSVLWIGTAYVVNVVRKNRSAS